MCSPTMSPGIRREIFMSSTTCEVRLSKSLESLLSVMKWYIVAAQNETKPTSEGALLEID